MASPQAASRGPVPHQSKPAPVTTKEHSPDAVVRVFLPNKDSVILLREGFDLFFRLLEVTIQFRVTN